MSANYGQNVSALPSIAYYSDIGNSLANILLASKGQGSYNSYNVSTDTMYPVSGGTVQNPNIVPSVIYGSTGLNWKLILEVGGGIVLLFVLLAFVLGGKK